MDNTVKTNEKAVLKSSVNAYGNYVNTRAVEIFFTLRKLRPPFKVKISKVKKVQCVFKSFQESLIKPVT